MCINDVIFVGNSSVNEITNSLGVVRKYLPGGSAIGSATAASFFNGLRIGIYSCIGDDFPLTFLEDTSIDTRYLCRSSHNSNRFVINEKTGEIYLVGNDYLPMPKIKQKIKTKHLHVSCREGVTPEEIFKNVEYETCSMDVMFSSIRKKRGSIRFCLPFLNVMFCNEQEYGKLNSILNLELVRKYSNLIIFVTRAERGLSIYFKEESLNVPTVPMEKEKIVSTTGAGDAYIGGFLGGCFKKNNVKEAIAYGLSIAGVSIEDFGVYHILRRHQEIENRHVLIMSEIERRRNSQASSIFKFIEKQFRFL